MNPLRAAACLLLLVSASAGAEEILVLDADAEIVSAEEGGALYGIESTAAPDATPALLASRAPLVYPSGLACRPADRLVGIADLGLSPTVPASVLALDCMTPLRREAQGAPLREAFASTFLGDGRLAVVDPNADPSGLGPDVRGGFGPGALFAVDLDACPGCPPTLLADGTVHAFGPAVRTAFVEPLGVEWDAVTGLVYVLDVGASVGAPTGEGRLFSVDPATGMVRVVSASGSWDVPISVTVRNDGTPLVVDSGPVAGASAVWEIDLANPDPTANARLITGGTQYAVLQDAAVGPTGTVYLADWGDYDVVTATFLVPPAIWRIDERIADPTANGVLVNRSASLISPVSIAVPRVSCARETDCANGSDDDGDGGTDCDDADCDGDPACPEPALAINRAVSPLVGGLVGAQFDASCAVAPFALCPEETVPGDLGAGMRLVGEALPSGTPSLRLYEHSDRTATMRISRSGGSLLLAAR